MKRLALTSLVVGSVVGCAAYSANPEQQTYAMPPQHVATALRCWAIDEAMPAEFGSMDPLVTSEKSRLYIVGRRGNTALIGEVVPGVACILSEGSEA